MLLLTAFAAPAARAASLQKVEQSTWRGGATLPTYVNMYIYVPDKLADKPAILVASHHCQGTGSSTFSETRSSFVPLADKHGFIMILPEATGHNCWDVGSDRSLKHDGGGDTHAVAQMVRYTLTKYGADPGRVYAFGGSSGGMMTQALLGVYPDIFMGGVAVSGVPCGCWAEQYTGDVATNGQWSGPCAGGKVTKTAEQWGDLVRSMFPGYTGHRPRVQLWHGNPDSTISYNNMGEAIKEWTNLLALSTTPTATDTPKSGTTHQTWKSACGFPVLETFSIAGAGHAVQWDIAVASAFLGLDQADGPDPETAACPGTGGTGGAGGSGGVSGSGGSGGGGTIGDGGRGDSDGGDAATGGRGGSSTGGSSGGGAGGGGGGGSGGNAVGTGGGSGGMASGGTTVATGGAAGSGGASAEGGATGSGGTLATSGGAPGSGGERGSGGMHGSGGASAGSPAADSAGCSCGLAGPAPATRGALLGLLLVLGASVLYRRASRSRRP